MGFIRKVISGSAAVATGGMSLGVVQFRSDTERGTRQLSKLRRDLAQTGGNSGNDLAVGVAQTAPTSIYQVASVTGTDALEMVGDSVTNIPDDNRAGWKRDPEVANQERFWNGKTWTSKTRMTS
jgi:hypothetical protein